MKYYNTKEAVFLERPNRFIAMCEIDGKIEKCHVINTGRMNELTVKGARGIVCEKDGAGRKTKYDLISLEKDGQLINIDSQAPNKLALEMLDRIFDDIITVKPECKYKNSRFDIFVETKTEKAFVEVKGVTLKDGNIARFPDAPTERGLKHVNELIESMSDGYNAYILLIIKMKGIDRFSPNRATHPEFADALKKAYDAGVKIIALDCIVSEDEIICDKFIDIDLEG
ncbi:MAG: DNA/RNA nuclease SfsA [Anaerofustis stercorihominis]|nr:DNA/RNA nuclease SfsA [Anaerofustis stercorihominis]